MQMVLALALMDLVYVGSCRLIMRKGILVCFGLQIPISLVRIRNST